MLHNIYIYIYIYIYISAGRKFPSIWCMKQPFWVENIWVSVFINLSCLPTYRARQIGWGIKIPLWKALNGNGVRRGRPQASGSGAIHFQSTLQMDRCSNGTEYLLHMINLDTPHDNLSPWWNVWWGSCVMGRALLFAESLIKNNCHIELNCLAQLRG